MPGAPPAGSSRTQAGRGSDGMSCERSQPMRESRCERWNARCVQGARTAHGARHELVRCCAPWPCGAWQTPHRIPDGSRVNNTAMCTQQGLSLRAGAVRTVRAAQAHKPGHAKTKTRHCRFMAGRVFFWASGGALATGVHSAGPCLRPCPTDTTRPRAGSGLCGLHRSGPLRDISRHQPAGCWT